MKIYNTYNKKVIFEDDADTIKEYEERITALKEAINDLLEKDRQRIAWKDLVEHYYDADTFMEVKIDIEKSESHKDKQ